MTKVIQNALKIQLEIDFMNLDHLAEEEGKATAEKAAQSRSADVGKSSQGLDCIGLV